MLEKFLFSVVSLPLFVQILSSNVVIKHSQCNNTKGCMRHDLDIFDAFCAHTQLHQLFTDFQNSFTDTAIKSSGT